MASFFLQLTDAGSPRGTYAAIPGDLHAVPPRVSALRDVTPALGNGHFLCRDDRALPLYGQMKDAPHGLYLGLLHGRNHLDTPLDGLGYPGPAIGPLCHVRTAYAAHLYLRFADPATAQRFFPGPDVMDVMDIGEGLNGLQDEVVIDIVNSTIPFDGRFFGDWMVFYHGEAAEEL
jgi:hypothetical protein